MSNAVNYAAITTLTLDMADIKIDQFVATLSRVLGKQNLNINAVNYQLDKSFKPGKTVQIMIVEPNAASSNELQLN